MNLLISLCILCATFKGLCEGAGLLVDDLLNAPVGGKVLFTTNLTPQDPPVIFNSVIWSFETLQSIITSLPHVNKTTPGYEGRITLFMSTGSLELRNLALNDSGEYTVTIVTLDGEAQTGSTKLMIYEPVSNVTITTSSLDLVEFISSVHLSCSSSGTSLSFLWLNGSSEVTASDRVQLTGGGSNLTIFNVTRYDHVTLRCRVVNPISTGTSDPVFLSVSFGPEKTSLNLSPSEHYYEDGSNVNLTCSAVSSPPAHFQWIGLSVSGPELPLLNMNMNQTGNYSCQAFNNKTNRSQTSQPAFISVLQPVSNVMITTSSLDLVEFIRSVHLSCSSSGSSLSFLWLNGSSEVTASDRVQLTDGGSNLTIFNVTRYDHVTFRCRVVNPISTGTSDPVFLSVSFGPENTRLNLSPSEHYYEDGSNVNLTCSAVSSPPAHFQWIGLSVSGPELPLLNMNMNQTGNYSCQAFNTKTKRSQTSQPAFISVLKPVSNVMITTSSTDLVEFISSVHLSCSSSGSSLSFLWLNGSSEVTASDRVQLTGHNLTIFNVTRYNEGTFRCRVVNPVSNSTSDPVFLSVSFGPENTRLNLSPSENYYEDGSNVNLTCSAVSSPPAHFQWIGLSVSGPELPLLNLNMNQTGNYSCQAFNNKTKRSQTSQPAFISVLQRISGTSVNSTTNQAVEGNSVNLTCEAAGSVFSRQWKKDGSDLILTNNMTLNREESVLSFQSLKRTNSGKYSCIITNPINSVEAEYNMVVNYGPDGVQITGPREINVKHTLTLTCSADSTPSATYTWSLNTTEILSDSAEFTKPVTEFSDSGSYTCTATNNVTGRRSTTVHALSVTDNQPPRCNSGCIAGITIACCLIVGLCAGGLYFVSRRRKQPTNLSQGDTRTGGGIQNSVASSSNQDVTYENIDFIKSQDGGTVQLRSK
ncbi:carcinoembryonic antigen-related cell adhesion molecule 5-like [Platichthys flesus]|uniref:carcinoembryonic antigen-related cell adhesion molecule 5-like n=1 Tax=Platichthys flesus TaxID=8260 RepID=UPI002DBE22DF|nr:carcinoembryonic antigen-related cell adhesion molecule 5-like [Platichthys flesus]